MPWLPKKSVVVPIDFSDDAFAALDTAMELVADPSHVHAIHILPYLEVTDPGVIWEAIDDESRRKHAADAMKERLAAGKYRGLTIQIGFGDPGREVADYAESQKAELIVLSSHGRTGISRLLIGSVAERIVRLAHCPVLVLRK
jgi:nucleotide-binding universal stress UspA family protein